jgi:predicted HAD superfamily Cof-like phosphohydrolase
MKMHSPDSIKQVAAFHSTFQHPIEPTPTIPAENRCKLRVELLSEELKELQQAINDNDIVEIADALCDLQYVLSGAILEFGFGDKFKSLFEEVHRSNMSKSCATEEEANATVAHYLQNHQTPAYFKIIDGKYLVFRTQDNKTLKSINYSPANIKGMI